MTRRIQSLVPDELAKAVIEQARSQNRSVSNYVETLLNKEIKK